MYYSYLKLKYFKNIVYIVIIFVTRFCMDGINSYNVITLRMKKKVRISLSKFKKTFIENKSIFFNRYVFGATTDY